MIKLITNDFFINFVIPVITTGLAVFFNIVSRNDHYNSFKKEDLSIGIEVSITAILLLVTDTVSKLKRISDAIPQSEVINGLKSGNAASLDTVQVVVPNLIGNHNSAMSEYILLTPYLIFIIFLGIICISFLIRKLGWETESDMNLAWGIIVPNIFGLATLLFVALWINR